jgi:hypothetical protein
MLHVVSAAAAAAQMLPTKPRSWHPRSLSQSLREKPSLASTSQLSRYVSDAALPTLVYLCNMATADVACAAPFGLNVGCSYMRLV